MLPREVERRRPAEVVPHPARTLVMPKPVGTHVVRGLTKKETLKRVHKLARRGYVLEASPIAEFHTRAGGGYGVKVLLAKPLPEPMPAWAKGVALVGTVLSGLGIVGVLVLNAIASVVAAAAALPWGMILGGLAVVAGVLAFTRPGRACCRIVVEVWH